MEVECLNDILVYLVMWLFGKLCCIFTKLLVIVSVYRRATLRKTIGPCDVGHVTYFVVITL